MFTNLELVTEHHGVLVHPPCPPRPLFEGINHVNVIPVPGY